MGILCIFFAKKIRFLYVCEICQNCPGLQAVKLLKDLAKEKVYWLNSPIAQATNTLGWVAHPQAPAMSSRKKVTCPPSLS